MFEKVIVRGLASIHKVLAWVFVVFASVVVLAGGTAHAGPYQWWTWTGDAGDNDLGNPANWRFSQQNNTTYYPGNMGTDNLGNGYVHPLFVTGNGGNNVVSQRVAIYGSTAPGGSKTVNVPAGESFAFTSGSLANAVGGGVTVNVNGGTLGFSGESGLNGSFAVGDNGLVTDPFLWSSNNQTNSFISWPYNQPSTIKVSNGGTFIASSLGNSYGNGTNGNLGVYIQGEANVNISGFYGTGSNNTSNLYGGGFLTIEGYDPASSLTINQLEFQPANSTPGVSGPGTLNVILDSSNGHGASNNFDTVSVPTWLAITNSSGGAQPTVPVAVNLVLSGYTPQAGDWFDIINAPDLETGIVSNDYGEVSPGALGSININGTGATWDQDFTVSGCPGSTFRFEQSYNGQSGVWLEVVSVTPEPSTLALLGAGAIGLVGYGLRRRRAARRTAKPTALDQPDAPTILSFPSHSSPESAARRAA